MGTESAWKVKKFETIWAMLAEASADSDKPSIVKLLVHSKSQTTYYPFEPMCVTATLLIRPWYTIYSATEELEGLAPTAYYKGHFEELIAFFGFVPSDGKWTIELLQSLAERRRA